MNIGLLSILGALTLTGCSSGTLPCNDEGIKQTALEIITGEIRKARYVIESEEDSRLSNYSVSGIKTLSHDEQTDFYTCSANFSFEYDGSNLDKEFTYELSYLEDTDNTDVGVYGIDGIKARILAKVMTSGMIKK
jgi:hypothetical protein